MVGPNPDYFRIDQNYRELISQSIGGEICDKEPVHFSGFPFKEKPKVYYSATTRLNLCHALFER